MKELLIKSKDELINGILAEWNPINVPEHIALSEYKRYISLILQSMESEEKLLTCLEDILTNKIELEYDSSTPLHKEDLLKVVKKIRLIVE